MNIFKRLLRLGGSRDIKLDRKKTKRPSIKGAFSRKVIRLRARSRNGYTPGSLGLSDVSRRIKNEYGQIHSRQERKRLHKGKLRARPIFYNGQVHLRTKGRKAQ